MNTILAKSATGQLIELGIGLLPEVISALKTQNPNLPQILAESEEFADTLIEVARIEKAKLREEA